METEAKASTGSRAVKEDQQHHLCQDGELDGNDLNRGMRSDGQATSCWVY